MPKPEPAFSTTDAQRLTTCLDGIADDASELRWAALDQLRYFCDGANAALLEAIGGKRFPTLAVLVELLDTAARLGGPIAVRKCVDVRQRVPVGLVVQLLECLLCNATSNLKPFLKMPNGIKNLVTTLSHYEDLIYDAEGPDILDRACNVLSYCTFYHPASAASIFIAADGVAVVTRMLNAAITHYTRTLARPGTALPSRPMPLSGSSAQWDSLTGNICELVSNVSSANSQAQKAFTQGGALRSLIDLVPLLTTTRSMTVAQGQPSLTFATEQVLLAAATLVWCTPQSQTMLLEAGTIVSALAPPRPHPPPRPNAPRAPPLVSSLSSFISALSSFISALSSFFSAPSRPQDACLKYIDQSAAASAPASSNLDNGEAHHEAHPTPDTIVSQACLLLVLNSQLENKPMQSSVLQRAEKVSSRAAKAGHTHELRSELAALYTLHQEMFEAIEHIRLNHYHSDEVVKSLKLLARSLPSKGEAPYLLVHMHGTQTLELMIRCVSNIDEEVLSHACLACLQRCMQVLTTTPRLLPHRCSRMRASRATRSYSARRPRASSSFASKASLSSPSACATTTPTSRPPRCASYACSRPSRRTRATRCAPRRCCCRCCALSKRTQPTT
jgi:hypothetical protein